MGDFGERVMSIISGVGKTIRRPILVAAAVAVATVCALVLPLGCPGSALAASSTSARIHVWSGSLFTDAIILESNGRFGLVDAGEDNDSPNGSNPLYPLRKGITQGCGIEEKLVAHMESLGVTESNLEFVIVTHPHSDHMGGADTVIQRFKPKRVYAQEYKDEYITNPAALWDNLYVYNQMLSAAKAVGSTVIQKFDRNAPVDPRNEAVSKRNIGTPSFLLGGMKIEIMNYGEDYKKGQPDANYFSLGVKLSANGKTAFLAGDINNYDGDETRLARQLGRVDLLKMGHHGGGGSNTPDYLRALRPGVLVQTGRLGTSPVATFDTIDSMGSRHYTSQEAMEKGIDFAVFSLSERGITCNLDNGKNVQMRRDSGKRMLNYRNGRKTEIKGWIYRGGLWHYFNGRYYAEQSRWSKVGGKWYLFDEAANMATGWRKVSGNWYYLDPTNGAMATGWRFVAGRWYFMAGSGAMRTGWQKLGDSWFYFLGSGAMTVGWQKVGDNWYYMNESGAMARGWRYVAGRWYYLRSSGAMATGWVRLGSTWYYFYNSGSMAKNVWIQGRYWVGDDGSMTVSSRVDGGRYYVDAQGEWVPGK